MIWLLEVFGGPEATLGGSWGLRNLISSALSVSQVPQEAPWRLSDGFLTCSGAPQVHFGGSWRLWEALGVCKIKIHRACRCLRSCQRAPRGSPRHDPSALSVFGRLTNHDLSCLLMSGGVPECSEVMICRACRCLEASRNALKSRSIVPVGVWRPPRVLRHGFLTCSGAPQAPLPVSYTHLRAHET